MKQNIRTLIQFPIVKQYFLTLTHGKTYPTYLMTHNLTPISDACAATCPISSQWTSKNHSCLMP